MGPILQEENFGGIRLCTDFNADCSLQSTESEISSSETILPNDKRKRITI